MTKEQIVYVQDYLKQSGLTYEQLQSELLDHIVCDVEVKMEEGFEFETAWKEVKNKVPKGEVKNIQNETMEILQKRINSTKLTAMFSAILLFASTGFKLMHWPGANELILIALFVFSISLMMGVIRNYRLSKIHKGTGLLIVVTILVLIFIASIVLKIINYPFGTEGVHLGSVILLSVSLPLISLYFYKAGIHLRDHSIIQIIGQNKTYIEKSLLILIGFGVLYKLLDLILLEGLPLFMMPTIFILIIVLTGLYQFSLTWIRYTIESSEEGSTSKIYLLIFSSIAIILFLFPTVSGIVSPDVKWTSVTMSYLILSGIVIVYHLKHSLDEQRYLLSMISLVCLGYIVANYLLRIDMNTYGFISTYIYNIGVLVGLILSLAFFYKKPVFRIYMMLILSYYMFSYTVSL